jgi:hypothetical protein
MDKNKNILISIGLMLFLVVLIPVLASCGKSGATVSPNTASAIDLEIVNAGPDVLPINLFINYNQVNTSAITYPNNTGYLGLTTITPPVQIRTAELADTTLFTINNTLLPNVKYSLFVTGLRGDNSLTTIFTTDTTPTPTIGRGKVRFVNASPRTLGLDLYANGTTDTAFTNKAFKAVSTFVELPAGNYNFQVYNHGNTTNVLTSLTQTTIQDGKIYTIYTYGLVGRTDTSAFAAAVIVNH